MSHYAKQLLAVIVLLIITIMIIIITIMIIKKTKINLFSVSKSSQTKINKNFLIK